MFRLMGNSLLDIGYECVVAASLLFPLPAGEAL